MKIDRQKLAQNFYNKNFNYSKLAYNNESLLPHRYVLVLTNLCNLKCAFCFQERKKKDNSMSEDDWIELIKQIPKDSRITLTGGEPLVFKGFNNVFKEANNYSETNIITNGLLLSEEKINFILSEKNFKILGISIDNIGNTNRDFKKKQWEDLVKNINLFDQKRQMLNHAAALDIKTVFLDEHVDQLFDLHKYCFEQLKADTHSIILLKGADIQHSDIMFPFEAIVKEYKAYKYKNFDKFIVQLNLIKEYNFRTGAKAFLHPNIINLNDENEIKKEEILFLNNEDHDPEKFTSCLSPWTSLHINVDGNIFPCMAVSMGNIKKNSLREIFFSKIYSNFKKKIKEKKTIGGCNRCGWLKIKENT